MNDNKPPEQRPFEIDINVTWHQCVTNFVIKQRDRSPIQPNVANPGPEPLRFLVDGVEVPRDDFRAVMELVTLVSRSCLTSV